MSGNAAVGKHGIKTKTASERKIIQFASPSMERQLFEVSTTARELGWIFSQSGGRYQL